jgi:hypothetical protein
MVSAFKGRLKLGRLIERWIEIVCRYYWVFILVTVSVGVGLGSGALGASSSKEYVKLMSPVDGPGLRARNKLYKEFEDFFDGEVIYIVAKGDGNILTLKHYQEIARWNTQYREFTSGGKNYTDLCYRATYDTPCIDASPVHPLGFWQIGFDSYDLSGVTSDEQLLAQIHSGRSIAGIPVKFDLMFGGPEPSNFINADGTNNLTYAIGVTYAIPMVGNNSLSDDLEDWEGDFEDFCDDFNDDNDYIEVRILTNTGLSRDAQKNVTENIGFIDVFPGLLIYLPVYLLLFVRFDPHSSKVSVGIICFVSSALSVFESIGLLVYTDANDTLIALAIAASVTILLMVHQGYYLARYFEYSEQKDPIDHVKATFRQAGPPLLAVSCVYILCFASLSMANVYRLTYASYYLAIICTFSLVNNFTFVPAMMLLQAKAYSKQRGDLFGLCCCAPTSVLCCFGKISKNKEGEERHLANKIANLVTKFVMKPIPKYLFLGVFLAFTGVNLYFASGLNISNSIYWGLRTDSMVYKALRVAQDHFKEYGHIVAIVSRDAVLSKEANQIAMLNLIRSTKYCTGCAQNWFVEDSFAFWYPSYQAYVGAGSCVVDNTTVALTADRVVSEAYFMPCLQSWLNAPGTANFVNKPNMKYSSDGSTLIGTFNLASMKILEGDNEIRTGISDVRDLIRNNGPGDSFIFALPHIGYDAYIDLNREATIYFVLTIFFMFVICATILLSISSALTICIFPLFTALAQLAAIKYFSLLMLNNATCFMVTISIAGSLEYYIYFFYFLINEPGSVNQRIQVAMGKVAWPSTAKTICILTAALVIGLTPRFYKFWPLAMMLGVVNLLQLIFIVPFPTYWVTKDFLAKAKHTLLSKKKFKLNLTDLNS